MTQGFTRPGTARIIHCFSGPAWLDPARIWDWCGLGWHGPARVLGRPVRISNWNGAEWCFFQKKEGEDLLFAEVEDLLLLEEEDHLLPEEEDVRLPAEENLLLPEEEDPLLEEKSPAARKRRSSSSGRR